MFVRELATRPGRRGSNVVVLDSGTGLASATLRALASLIAQARQLLPEAIRDVRDQELTWTQIDELLHTTAAHRLRNKP